MWRSVPAMASSVRAQWARSALPCCAAAASSASTASASSEGETLTLSHAAGDRSMFARGAIAAALWVAGRPPGEYDMRDVLGLTG